MLACRRNANEQPAVERDLRDALVRAAIHLPHHDDVIERRPCRYALRAALRHLRQTSRFLPSIAEVLAALDEAQTRIRNTAFHVEQIPAALERARADFAAMRSVSR